MIPQIAESLIVTAGECVAQTTEDAFAGSTVGSCNAFTHRHRRFAWACCWYYHNWLMLTKFSIVLPVSSHMIRNWSAAVVLQ